MSTKRVEFIGLSDLVPEFLARRMEIVCRHIGEDHHEALLVGLHGQDQIKVGADEVFGLRQRAVDRYLGHWQMSVRGVPKVLLAKRTLGE